MTPGFVEGLPPELAAEQQALLRRQAVAQAMAAQGQRPIQGGMAGRFYVPPSPLQGLAQVVSAYAGNKMARDVDAGMADIGKRYNAGVADAVKAYTDSATTTRPAIEEPPDELGGGPGREAMQVPTDPRVRVAQALASPYGQVRELGKLDFEQANRREDREDRQAAAAQTAQLAREQRAADLQARLADQRITAQERAALQKELAQMQIDARRDMVKLAASLRQAPQAPQQQIIQGPNGPMVLGPGGQATPVLGPDGQPVGNKPKAKADPEVEKTLNLYVAARNGLISGLSGAASGPLAGRMPAVSSAQQTAEGGVAAMAPVLKQLFRVAGEGTFTDKDQELLLNMVPTRKDSPKARADKTRNIDNIVAAKLGVSVPPAPGLEDSGGGAWEVVR